MCVCVCVCVCVCEECSVNCSLFDCGEGGDILYFPKQLLRHSCHLRGVSAGTVMLWLAVFCVQVPGGSLNSTTRFFHFGGLMFEIC